MGRAKQRMELISNEKTRFMTFQKRKKGLLKKAYELKTLCDVQVCVIIYGPRIDHRPVEPEIWPASPDDIRRLMDSYRKQPAEDRCRKTVDITNFFEDRKQKIEDEINKLRKKNEEARYTKWDDRYDAFTKEQLLQFEDELGRKITELKEKVERMKGSAQAAMVRYYYPGQHDLCGNNYLGYDGLLSTSANLPNAMMTLSDNYHHHQHQHHHPYLMYNQMDRALVSYETPLMMIGQQKNLPHFNNNLVNHGQQVNGLDSQQVLGQWQYTQPQMGLPQMGLTHFYPTNPGQFDRSM